MRILACADIHGKTAVYEWLACTARGNAVDAVVLAGDLLGVPDGFESVDAAQRFESTRVRECLESLPVPVLYVMGNDDWVDLGPASRRVLPLHLARVVIGRFAFVGYECTLPFAGGPRERSEPEQEVELRILEPWLDPSTIVVTHGPARGVLDRGVLDEPAGSAALAALLSRRPFRLHVHGHTHASFGRDGAHLNVAGAGRRCGMLVDLETLEHEALADS